MADIKTYDSVDNANRGHVGAGGQWCVWDNEYNKFRLVCPTETLPSVAGSQDTVDHDVMTSLYKSKIPGKISLDAKEFSILHNRDDIMRIQDLIGSEHEFLNMYPDRTGRRYRGTLSFRENDASSSDKVTDTIVITPSWVAEKPTLNVMDMVIPTNVITSVIDEQVEIQVGGKYTIPLTSVVAGTFEVPSGGEGSNSAITGSITSKEDGTKALQISVAATATKGSSGIVKVVSSASGYAKWFATILVIVK